MSALNEAKIMKAAGVVQAASALSMYARGRRERGQISARTMRELMLAADVLLDLAIEIRNKTT